MTLRTTVCKRSLSKFTTLGYCCKIVHPQHGGRCYFRQKNVTVTRVRQRYMYITQFIRFEFKTTESPQIVFFKLLLELHMLCKKRRVGVSVKDTENGGCGRTLGLVIEPSAEISTEICSDVDETPSSRDSHVVVTRTSPVELYLDNSRHDFLLVFTGICMTTVISFLSN